MRNAFTVSIVGHVAVLLAAVVTLPSAESAAERLEANTLPVDLVTLADFTEITRGVETGTVAAPPATPAPTNDAVPVPRPESTPAPEPTPAPVAAAPEPTPAPAPAPEPTPAPAPEPTPVAATPEPAPPPAPAAEPAPAPAPTAIAEPAPAPAPTPEPAPAPQPLMQPTTGAVPRARPARPEPTPPTPEPTPTPQPTQTAAAAPAQRPTPPAPTPTPTPAPQPAATVPTPEPALPVVAAPTTAPTLDELLNNALANANANAAAQPAPAQQPLGVANGTQTAAMTQTERAALIGMIRDAVGRCWNPPPGWTNPADVRVVLQFRLNRDGSVAPGLPTVIERPNGAYAAAAVESAQRAIYVCAPYAFPADLYDGPDGWQEVRVTFDPIEMF